MVTLTEERTQEADVLSTEELQYAPLEAKLLEWGMPYTVNREFPIEDIVIEESAQVRFAANIAPKDRVDEYKMQMQSGAVFPPILLRVPGNVIIDGNTRVAAAKKIGRKAIPALLVDTKTEDMHQILAAAVNQMGGERLKAAEAHATALLMLRVGYPDAAIAREMGRDQSQVRKWRSQQEVLERAKPLGIDLGALARTTLEPLSDIRLEKPFIEAARLFTEVRPKQKEAKDIVEKVAQAVSEEGALQAIQEIREELAPVGPPPKAASREIPLARAAIGNLVKFEGRPSAAFDPAKREEELGRWQRLQKIVQDVVAAIEIYQTEMPAND